MEVVARNLLRYLGERGFIAPGALVDGGVTISVSRSRNRFVQVKQPAAPCYFVKQALASEPISAQTVAREAEVYRRAFAGEGLAPLCALLPSFHGFDADAGLLVTELVEGAETLSALHRRLGHCPTDLAHRLGAGLAAVHRVQLDPAAPEAELFARTPPWVLQLGPALDTSYLRRSSASSELVDMLLAMPVLAERMAALHAGWTRRTLIHTDLRWDNVLVAPRTAPLEGRRLYLIDWELADLGDPAWDVGSMLHAFLAFWLASVPLDGNPDDMAAGATRPLEAVQPAIAAFWAGYLNASGLADRANFLDRCVGMAAARLLITALEMSVWVEALPGRALLFVQTALNMLDDPRGAARTLLGLVRPRGARG